MSFPFYNPFENIFLDSKTCFLTGVDLPDENHGVNIFPDWILDRFELRGKTFTMMDQVSSFLYEDLKLPCSSGVEEAFANLEEDIQNVFALGYEGVRTVDTHKLFLWMGKIVYGILYHDLLIEKERLRKLDKEFSLSPRLKERFSLFHLMLQSLVSPVSFKGVKPWSVSVVRLKYSKDIFNYRDDPVRLMFSLGMNGFGIIACLQDNGMVQQHQEGILKKIGNIELHPIQFEELCARFYYSNYLLATRPRYNMEEDHSGGITIEAVAGDNGEENPKFEKWDEKMFARVLAGYWEPWGLKINDIITVPNDPISFLINEYTEAFISPDTIRLPF
ncbi:MAG: hypothetical protein H3C48_15500 [Chitinophagaceae bacterium]|nr:hypothetical protein [Chitinophagaceae bacterium]